MKIYFKSRDSGFEGAGLGVCREFLGKAEDYRRQFAAMHQFLAAQAGPMRLYGGTRFNQQEAVGSLWANFGAFRFVLPKAEIIQTDEGCELIAWDNSCDTLAELEEGLARPPKVGNLSRPIEVQAPKTRHDFESGVQRSLQEIQKGPLTKIVLASQKDLVFDKAPNPFDILRALQSKVENAFFFAFQNASNNAYLGASPELLFRRTGTRIQTEAVAGTRPRGENAQSDLALGQALLESPKDCAEQAVVHSEIENALAEFCLDFGQTENIHLLKMPNVQHLRTRFEGILKNKISDFEILERLNPTPAVCGFPKNTAQKLIGELESFERGCYAGPVGYIGNESSEMAVGIRSALLKGNALSLFAGAGIVDGSEPSSEWEEIQQKMKLFSELF